MKRVFKEEDMYPLVEEYFENLGYRVNAEVNNCDVVATKDDEVIIIELKKSLSLELLVQATKRQKISDLTYMVTPKPLKFKNDRKFQDLVFLIKRLGLGLIFINENLSTLEVIIEPMVFDFQKSKINNKKNRVKLLKEVNGRVSNLNRGGQMGKKLMTSYREDCIKLLYIVSELDVISPKDGVELGIRKTQSILNENYYNWFIKIDRGRYSITEDGNNAINEYRPIIDGLTADLKEKFGLMLTKKKEISKTDIKTVTKKDIKATKVVRPVKVVKPVKEIKEKKSTTKRNRKNTMVSKKANDENEINPK